MTPIVQAIVKLLTAKETVTFIVKGVRMGLKIGSLIKFVSVVQAVQAEVSKLISDGDFTPDEAEAEAAKLLSGEDLKVKVSGEDVLDAKAQDYLVRGLARVGAAIAKAKLS
jgi:hypothetical protein